MASSFCFKLPAAATLPSASVPTISRLSITTTAASSSSSSTITYSRCSTARNPNVETGCPSGGDSVQQPLLTSETKQAALDIGTTCTGGPGSSSNSNSNSSSLVAFYADHHRLPLKYYSSPSAPLFDKCHATRLVLEGDSNLETLLLTLPSPLASSSELCLVYGECYIQSLVDGDWNAVEEIQHPYFTWSHELVTRSLASTGGAVAAMHVVMLGLRLAAASLSGHGFRNHVEGYYLTPSGVFDDVAVAIAVALQSYPHTCNSKRPVLVIDLDVHQGKTENIRRMFAADSRVLTFSLHGSEASALWEETVAHHDDSSLLDCTGDDYYLAMLSNKLQRLLELHNPSLVFFQAGVDALSEDVSGKLSMTRHGLIHRNNIVYTACYTRRIPLVITMGCGYSNPLQACIQAHADVYRAAALRYGTTHMSL